MIGRLAGSLVAVALVGCSDAPDTRVPHEIPPCTEVFQRHDVSDLPSVEASEGWHCELPSPCGAALVIGPGLPVFEDIDAARCILEQLRDRVPARVRYERDTGPGPGMFVRAEEIFIIDSEHAVSNISSKEDLSGTFIVNNRGLIKPPSYFQGCLDQADHAEILRCLQEWSSGCAEVEVACPAAGSVAQ